MTFLMKKTLLHTPAGILIMGGAHQQEILRTLQQQNITYLIVAPVEEKKE